MLNLRKIGKVRYCASSGSHGDFWVDDKCLFEVGGKNLALDNIESGINNKIPLWLFGFLY